MFSPRADDNLTVTLPGETMRAKVKRVVDRNTVFVEIGQPMTRSHNYRLGDLVACRRTPGVLGETWQALDDRVLFNRPVAPEPEIKPAPAAKKLAAKGARANVR
jgi:hypothetical protein